MKVVQYFQHDYNARHDEKLTKLRRVLGADGIGIYWCVIECLYSSGGKLPLDAIEDIAYDLRFDANSIEKVVKDFGLFQLNNTHFWSNTVISRLKERSDISSKRREAALAKYSKNGSFDANAQQMENKCTANAEQMECNIKYKSIKEKEKIKIENNNIDEEDKSSSTHFTSESDSEPHSIKTDYKEIQEFYNRTIEGTNLPKCIKITENRKNAIRARMKEFGRENLFLAITKAAESAFLNGSNDRNWQANFDWVFNSQNMAKILECKYDNDKYGTGRQINQSRAAQAGIGAFKQLWDDRQKNG